MILNIVILYVLVFLAVMAFTLPEPVAVKIRQTIEDKGYYQSGTTLNIAIALIFAALCFFALFWPLIMLKRWIKK